MSEKIVAIGSTGSGRQPSGDDGRKRWVSEMRYTWILVLLLSVVPAVIYGTAFPAGLVLMATVVFGLPTGLAALLVKDKAWRGSLWRRLVVLGLVSGGAVALVNQADKLTPGMATPIVQAIEQFKLDTGAYPNTLAELNSKYLEHLPAVRVAFQQPEVTYVLREGHPKLKIPSAAGDAFASHEYNFEERRWEHNN
ncbi:hypothetical protein WG219_15155 [Ectopseudomonas mendocina]|uniref:Uncharacterized protein n=1 Tax=Ectopseudomonas mendocina TaxID=300 RepID=A0ABZ2RC77_ECTME